MSEYREQLPYQVILLAELVKDETIEWCEDQIGQEWSLGVMGGLGKWTGHSVKLGSEPRIVIFSFANEKDAIFFKLRWS